MYYPKKFKLKRAVELAVLVEKAYDQFDSFESKMEWNPIPDYRLIKEIKYTAIGNRFLDIENKINKYVLNLNLIKIKNLRQVPVGYIAEKKGDVFIVFRGTQTPKEWVNNFNAKLTPYFDGNSGSVHDGFQDVYRNIRDIILGTLKNIKKKKNIYVAGHSLGGAFATFASYDIETTQRLKIKALYTFGSPRVGDNAFVTKFNSALSGRSFRIANTSDIVTDVPLPMEFANLFGGYFSHVDTPVVFTSQNNDIEKNHIMETYINALKK